MAQPSPSMQAGIFTNDLCISFRIILHELLDILCSKSSTTLGLAADGASASSSTSAACGQSTWDTQLKDRYRARVWRCRQITQLYRHCYLMYVEMYSESLNDVTVEWPSVAFVDAVPSSRCRATTRASPASTSRRCRLWAGCCCSALRRTLYELLVQQNNIKGISTSNPAQAPSPAVSSPASSPLARSSRPPSRGAVVEADEMHSHEIAMGQPDAAGRPMNMEALSSRLSRSTASVASPPPEAAASPPPKPPPVAMPSMHSSVLQQPAFSPNSAPAFKFFDNEPTEKSETTKLPSAPVRRHRPRRRPPPCLRRRRDRRRAGAVSANVASPALSEASKGSGATGTAGPAPSKAPS